ncbi:MAG: glycosyltransferase family 2 protein [Lachnospiraceae bacterium]|nr:glycosyltransferase family 2 protein [Lachnospiraceae bacterium]
MINTTVIIPNYNGMQYLENCLRSLAEEEACIIVVDNASTDGSFEMIADRFPAVRTIRMQENTGFCRAVNAGIAMSSTRYVIFLNNDTVVEPGFVKELETVMEQDKKIFSASAKILSMQDHEKIDDAGDFYCALGWAFARGKGKPESKYGKSCRIFAACGGASIYRRSLFKQIGTLDENHFAYLEDIDLGYRAQIYGYRCLFVPSARVYHAGSASSGSRYNRFKTDLTSRNSIYLIYKNMPLFQIVLNLPFFIIGFAVKTLFFTGKGMGGAYIKGLWKGFQLCLSEEGRRNKVRFMSRHFLSYCRIQAVLWINMIRRFC